MTRIIVIARYPTIRAGLKSVLDSAADLPVVADTEDPALLPALVEELDPNAVLIDLVDDPSETVNVIQRFAEDGLLPPVAMLFGSPTDALDGLSIPNASLLLRDAGANEIQFALRAASMGLVTIDPRIIAEIDQHLDWQDHTNTGIAEPVLSPRELQVLSGVARGLPNKTIASELGISEHTVKFHIGSIFTKLDVASRSEAVAVAARRGLIVL